MTADTKENITSISWTPSNKIDSIVKSDSRITYAYDAAGNRVRARVYNASNVLQKTTWYVRDASGTVLSIYEQIESGTMKLKEVPMYGSDRVGLIKPNLAWSSTAKDTIDAVFHRNAKERSYELKDHLGNVRAVVSDEVTLATSGEYLPNVLSRTDYYPFGMAMETRTEQQSGYRYGFNGKENDNEVKGAGNQIDFGARGYDPRIVRWMAVDPQAGNFPSWSPYVFAYDDPLRYVDPDGNRPGDVVILFSGANFSGAQLMETPGRIAEYIKQNHTNTNGGAVQAFASQYSDLRGERGNKNLMESTQAAYDFFKEHYNKDAAGKDLGMDHKSKAIIYGYSFGVVEAQFLSDRLQKEQYPVELLFTVDGSAGPQGVDDVVGKNVKLAINFYQRNREYGLRGVSMTAQNAEKTMLGNFNLTGAQTKDGETVAHRSMDEATEGAAQSAIIKTLDSSPEKK